MSRRPDPVPKYLYHSSGQARVRLRDSSGRRRDYLLGPYGSPESQAEYERVLALVRIGRTPWTDSVAPGAGLTVAELLLRYKRFVESYYADAKVRENILIAFRPARLLYSHLPAAEFSPLKLKAVRDEMVRSGLCRPVVNQRVGVIKRAFKWAVAEELVPAAVHHALQAVAGLGKGRTTAREPDPIRPVADAWVDAALPFAPPAVRAMIELQRLTGMRPGEVCVMRACDLETSGAVWLYRPHRHKTQYRGRGRVIALGPRAQVVVGPFLRLATEAYLFSPARSEADREADRRRRRKTPLYPSHQARYDEQRKENPERPAGDRYTSHSYNRAIARVVDRADRAARQAIEDADAAAEDRKPVRVAKKIKEAERLVAQWHPNQLRHTHATAVRRRFGLEAAQVVLGHARADVTQVYAEADVDLAVKVAAAVG